jgi:AraC-like DNA-binding protein
VERLFAGPEPLDDDRIRIFACDDLLSTPVAERVLPDGAVHLIFTLGDVQGGERNAHVRCLAVGASTQATRIVLAGMVEQVCVRLGIGTAAAVLGVPAAELTNHGVDLEAVWGPAATAALAQLADAPSDARVAVMARLLRARIERAERTSPVVGEAVRRLVRSGGGTRVRALAADLGVGERRLQQLFAEHVGLSPRAMARLARFRAVIERCRRAPVRSWSGLAIEHGFYDQAHLINEVKEFTGLTPRQLGPGGQFAFFQDPNAAAGLALSHADPP